MIPESIVKDNVRRLETVFDLLGFVSVGHWKEDVVIFGITPFRISSLGNYDSR